jgi:DNA invertase Pin-like site-specific DNA recombinase/DNA-binding winged helix-turn-helix (wHTH) protein
MKPNSTIPAAEYVRMSTDDQQFSIDNQKAAIHEYAARSGFDVVATYEDSGRSGLSIKNREGLRRLLKDVVSGNAGYKVILVYDVSRWGRFQDVDEAAHYEFVCKQAGIPIRYCAEQFENDGTLSGSVMKALKRTMAAEYSRELAVKVFAGQKRLVLLGFKVSGLAPYGLRRMLVAPDGSKKQLLRPHERKNIKSDRVVFVKGPRQETDCVKKIFSMGVFKKNTPRVIAAELNRVGLKFAEVRTWNEQIVLRILKNPLYTGCNIFGKTRRVTGGRPFRVPREQWIIKHAAFPALIDQNTFDRVQRVIKSRRTRPGLSDEVLLSRMKKVWRRYGMLTQRLLHKGSSFDYRTYCKRFGSVLAAYRLVGYKPSLHAYQSVAKQKEMRKLREQVLEQVRELFSDHVKFIRMPGQHQRQVIQLDGRLRFAVLIARPIPSTSSGKSRWQVRNHIEERGLPALICTADPKHSMLSNYYLVPGSSISMRRVITFGEENPMLKSGVKLQTLGEFYNAALAIGTFEVRDEAITVGDIVVTKLSSTIKVGERELILSRLEAAMLKLLLLNAGHVIPRQQFVNPVSGKPVDYLTPHMHVLRVKLGREVRARIQTIRGEGYLYKQPTAESAAEKTRIGLRLKLLNQVG